MSNIDNEVSDVQISSRIDRKITGITSDKLIFKIDDTLRRTCAAAYEPEIVSIGPYHRGKSHLQKMEIYKWIYLQRLFKRLNKTSARKFVDSLLQDEEEARRCYAEHVSLTSQEFVEMMLLDGCFIIEFLRRDAMRGTMLGDIVDYNDDPIFKMGWISGILRRDLLLFENQIPFFILEKLFDMTTVSYNNPTAAFNRIDSFSLISLAVSFLNGAVNNKSFCSFSRSDSISKPRIGIHLLSIMYEIWSSSFGQSISCSFPSKLKRSISEDGDINRSHAFWCINFGRKNQAAGEDKGGEDLDDMMFIKSVSELTQVGIKFVKAKQSTAWLEMSFKDGTIQIPPLVVDDRTESILRNLIAYEQYIVLFDIGHTSTFVTDYAVFMRCLINTPMDVQTLRVKGIIKNWLGNDKKVTEMFNSMSNHVYPIPSNFIYREHFKNVNEHCNKKRNLWIIDLKKTYFKNPWSIISLFAAILLLIFTFLQTVVSFLEHFKKDVKVVCTCK